VKSTRELFGITLALITVLVGCTSQPSAAVMKTSVTTSTPLPPAATGTPLPTKTEATSLSPCVLEPVVVPTRPAETPGYTQLDPDTGLHMTGTAQEIDLESYRLEVRGKVDHPLSLTYDDLRCLPKVEDKPVLECPGFFVDEATWAGVPIREVLALAGVQEEATNLNLISADGYSRQVPLTEGVFEAGFLAYEWEGEPLPILHGFPVRVVLPGISGGSWVKWLVAIEVK
jgi:DMSO/TMAO reductase YedYZ molybdopterin-dependent catalytic subunit